MRVSYTDTNEFLSVRWIYSQILKEEYGFDESTWINLIVVGACHEILKYLGFWKLDQYVHRNGF